MNKNNYAIIMAGGIGSRFWPISRSSHPKQFIDILGTGKTLIQNTYERFLKVCPKENIYVVTNENYTKLVKQQLPEMADGQILTEPVMRNTAPCVAYGCFKIESLNPEAVIVVAPSDQQILDEAVAEIKENYAPESVALELAQRRWQRLPAIDPLKKKKRVLDFLLRRGFDVNIVMKVIKKLV